jgi:hypothetical protein
MPTSNGGGFVVEVGTCSGKGGFCVPLLACTQLSQIMDRRPRLSGAFLCMARSRFNDPIEPMTLANMRENGVRSLSVQCHQCRHEVIINADHLPGHVTVPSFGPKMVCTKCGTIGADVRPNWREVTR